MLIGKKRSPIEVNKALTVMGFGTWNGLEPEVERETPNYVKNRLNKRLFDKITAIENKREEEQREAARAAKMTKEEKRIMKMEKRKRELKGGMGADELQRGAKKRSLIDEERAVHEAYQILMTEYMHKRAARDKANRAKAAEEEAMKKELLAQDMDTLKIDSAETLQTFKSGDFNRRPSTTTDTDDTSLSGTKRKRSSRRKKQKKKESNPDEDNII